eukprot:5584550-Amphidinium_carterae.1
MGNPYVTCFSLPIAVHLLMEVGAARSLATPCNDSPQPRRSACLRRGGFNSLGMPFKPRSRQLR